MNSIRLKPANLRTSVSRAKIRRAVEEAFAHFDLDRRANKPPHRAAKKAAKKKK
jgi:hypothetical protein